MAYAIKEIFYTLQGEGANAGRAAVFLRFAGCNLWSGLERHRSAAACPFCDTDFVGTDGASGGQYPSPELLAVAAATAWPSARRGCCPLVVCTGGEPLLQLDAAAVRALHAAGFEVAVETNGTRTPPAGIDWLTVSPKAGAALAVTTGNELKLVYPQAGAEPATFEALEFGRFYLQPMDGPERERNTRGAARYCLEHPKWRLSLQTHKFVGLP